MHRVSFNWLSHLLACVFEKKGTREEDSSMVRAPWTVVYVHKIDKTGLKVVIEFPLFFRLFNSFYTALGSCHQQHPVDSFFKIHHKDELRDKNTFSVRHFIQYLARSRIELPVVNGRERKKIENWKLYETSERASEKIIHTTKAEHAEIRASAAQVNDEELHASSAELWTRRRWRHWHPLLLYFILVKPWSLL